MTELSYRAPFERVDRLRAELADPTSPVAVELTLAHEVLAARRARIVAGSFSVVSTAVLQAIAVFHSYPTAWSTRAWLALAFVTPAVLFAIVRGSQAPLRARMLRRALVPRSDLASYMARLLIAGDPQIVVSRALGLEKASIAAPLAAIAFAVTTTVVWILGLDSPDYRFLPFAFSICSLPLIVGCAFAVRYAAHLARTPAVAWKTGPGAKGTVFAIAGAMVPCSLPVVGIPALVALVVAGITVPLAYRWARRRIAAERTALGVL